MLNLDHDENHLRLIPEVDISNPDSSRRRSTVPPLIDLLFLFLCLLPPSRAKNRILSLRPGWKIDPTARISPCLISNVGKLRIGARCRIGTGTIVRSLARLELAEEAYIGRLNQVTAARDLYVPDNPMSAVLTIGKSGGTTYRHEIDCSGGLEIGDFSVIGGSNTTILTHGVDLVRCVQTIDGVRIGAHVVILTRCVILMGVEIADRVIIGAGSVVTESLPQSEYLYAGVPAKPKKAMPASAGVFHLTTSYVQMKSPR